MRLYMPIQAVFVAVLLCCTVKHVCCNNPTDPEPSSVPGSVRIMDMYLNQTVDESQGPVQVCAMATLGDEESVQVRLNLIEGSASDIMVPNDIVTFTNEDSSLCWMLNTINDDVFEDTEVFKLMLVSISNDISASSMQAIIRIEDDDVVTVQMARSTADVTEGHMVSVCATISGAMLERDVVVQLATGDTADGTPATPDTDYKGLSMMKTFTASVSQVCVDIRAISDNPPAYENNEVFGVAVSVPSATANPRVRTGAMTTTTVQIIDGNMVTVQMANSTVINVVEGQLISVCANISGATLERDVVVQLATGDLVDTKAASTSTDYGRLIMMKTFTTNVLQVCLDVQTRSEDPPVFENFEVFGVTVSVVNPDSNPRVMTGPLTTTTLNLSQLATT